MADLTETAAWQTGIRQIETTDPVVGGAPNVGTGAGMANIPHLQLAERTAYLKTEVEKGVPFWSATVTYAAGNAVSHAGGLWIATAASTNSAPSVGNANWKGVVARNQWSGSIGPTGWRQDPDGIIVQWTTLTVPSAGTVTWTYPVAFPNDLLAVQVTTRTFTSAEHAALTSGVDARTFMVVDQIDNDVGSVIDSLACIWVMGY